MELPVTVAERIEFAQEQILDDIVDGVVPDTVRSFSDLHDYVDANEYGLCTVEVVSITDVAAVQTALDAWLGTDDFAQRAEAVQA